MVRLYFDVHIPRSVAEQLTKRGIDILTAQADHSATLPDHELLARASHMGRTIVTSDIRFRALAETWQKNRQTLALRRQRMTILSIFEVTSPCWDGLERV